MLMCAIAGILGLPVDASILGAMQQTMRRRGSDGKGCYQTPGATLLHTQLSLGSATDGAQPMVLEQGSERYVLSFQGELYNARELRRELEMLGHVFTGSSHAEVVLHAYTKWKAEMLEKCNGVFAFAVLEEHTGQVFLARDRIGVKPLFYMPFGDGLLFASEIKTILSYPGVRPRLKAEGVGEILLLGPGRTPGSGVFADLYEIEPGCYGVYAQGKLRITRYWRLRDREHTQSFAETAEVVRELVLDAVKRQMTADVPVGTFLSGGLDSSLISAICAREMEKKGERLQTFSLDYAGNDRYFTPGKFQPESDTAYIHRMQQALNSHHHWTVLTPQDLIDHIQAATIARDLPGMADVDSSLLAFCGQIRSHVPVILSGECADEIFGGYPWYRDPAMRDCDGFPWAQTTRERMDFLLPDFVDALQPMEFVHSRYAQTLAECDILPGTSPLDRRIKELVNLNFRWFMQTLLDRQERMSMYHGLTVRAPYCDYRIAEYLYGVPWEFKDHKGREKGLLRHAMADFLPDAVCNRKKSPYPKTYDPHYLEMGSELLRQILADPASPIFAMVRRQALQQLLEQEYTWPWYGQLMRRAQTIVYMVQITYWLEPYSVRFE